MGALAFRKQSFVLPHHNAASRSTGHGINVSVNRHQSVFLHTIESTTPV